MSAVASIVPRGRHYLAVFLLSLTVLMLEIAFSAAFLTGVAAYALALITMASAIVLGRSRESIETVAPARPAAASYGS